MKKKTLVTPKHDHFFTFTCTSGTVLKRVRFALPHSCEIAPRESVPNFVFFTIENFISETSLFLRSRDCFFCLFFVFVFVGLAHLTAMTDQSGFGHGRSKYRKLFGITDGMLT